MWRIYKRKIDLSPQADQLIEKGRLTKETSWREARIQTIKARVGQSYDNLRYPVPLKSQILKAK